MNLNLNQQVLIVKKGYKINILGQFKTPSVTEMNILFMFGCLCQGIDPKEALDKREIMLPTLNWKCGDMIISNLDRYSSDHPFAFFSLSLPTDYSLSKLKVNLAEVKSKPCSLPTHNNGYVVYEDKSYKWDCDIPTDVVVGKPAFTVNCPFEELSNIIAEKE